jgi:hypothetical protein
MKIKPKDRLKLLCSSVMLQKHIIGLVSFSGLEAGTMTRSVLNPKLRVFLGAGNVGHVECEFIYKVIGQGDWTR